MQIKLYYTSSENNQLSKELTLTRTLIGTLRNESDIVHPRVLLEAASLNDSNYAYISEFNRYYYIREIESIRNGIWLVTFETDPLMSFKNNIKQLNVILAETENTGIDNYLSDDRVWIAKVKDKTSIIQFPSGLLANGEYILITSGGVTT